MWKAGTASLVVTPAEPLWLAGYAARKKPAGGTISDLCASALTLEDESGGRLVIAAIDLIAVTPIITDRVYAAVEASLGLTRERLILAASHTHYGPEVRPDKAPFFNIPPEYAAGIAPAAGAMADALVRVIVESSKRLVPVRLFARSGRAGFAHNRRRDGVKGGTPSPRDVNDPTVNVLDVVHESTNLRKAIVFGYACHNTTIPPEDCRYCGDWAGFARREMERLNEHSTALFVAGCGADQNPEPRGTVELSRRYGLELAAAVQRSLLHDEGAPPLKPPPIELTGRIRAAREDVPLAMIVPTREQLVATVNDPALEDPPQKAKAKFLLGQIDAGRPLIGEYPAPMQVVRIGDGLLWIVLSGEPVIDWVLRLQREFAPAASHIWVSGYCNDMPGYLPTRRIQQEGGYEAGRATLWSALTGPFDETAEARITAAIGRLVQRVLSKRS